MSILFWIEILLGVVIPMILFSLKRIRQSPRGLLIGAIILLLGMILNRFDVSWFAVKPGTSVEAESPICPGPCFTMTRNGLTKCGSLRGRLAGAPRL